MLQYFGRCGAQTDCSTDFIHPAMFRHHRLDRSWRCAGVIAKVPGLHRCLYCNRNGNRNVGFHRNVPANAVGGLVPHFAVISWRETATPLHLFEIR